MTRNPRAHEKKDDVEEKEHRTIQLLLINTVPSFSVPLFPLDCACGRGACGEGLDGGLPARANLSEKVVLVFLVVIAKYC